MNICDAFHIFIICYPIFICSPTEKPAGMIDLKVVKDITPYDKGGEYLVAAVLCSCVIFYCILFFIRTIFLGLIIFVLLLFLLLLFFQAKRTIRASTWMWMAIRCTSSRLILRRKVSAGWMASMSGVTTSS